jgi:hypothetical protein
MNLAAVLFLLLALPRPGRAGVPMDGAGQLARTVDEALAGAAQVAEDPKQGLALHSPRYTPFWSSLQRMRTRVAVIENSLAEAEDEFLLLVDQGSSDLGELRVTWARTGSKNAQIAERLRTASVSYRQLRAHFGREGARLKQGGGLSEAERQQLARLQKTERRFAVSAQRLRDRARKQRDAATAAELERFRAEAERIAQASADLSSYLNALIAASEVRGEWQANLPYIRRTAKPTDLAAAEETVQDLYVDADIGHVFTADLGRSEESPAGGPALEESVTPAKVEILQPGDELEEPPAEMAPIVVLSDSGSAEGSEEGETAGEEEAAAAPSPETGEAEAPVLEELKPEAAKDGAPQPSAPAPGTKEGDAKAASSPSVPPIPPPIG